MARHDCRSIRVQWPFASQRAISPGLRYQPLGRFIVLFFTRPQSEDF